MSGGFFNKHAASVPGGLLMKPQGLLQNSRGTSLSHRMGEGGGEGSGEGRGEGVFCFRVACLTVS